MDKEPQYKFNPLGEIISQEMPIKITQEFRDSTIAMLKRGITECISREASLDIDTSNLKEFPLPYLFEFFNQLESQLYEFRTPLALISRIEYNFLKEEDDFYIYAEHASNYTHSLYTLMNSIREEQIKRRGYLDDDLDIKTKMSILSESVVNVKNELSKVKNHKSYKTQLIDLLELDLISIYDLILKAELNYTNKERTRYLLFETLILASFRIVIPELKEQYELSKTKMMHTDSQEEDHVIFKLRDHFLEVNGNNTLSYVWVLYCEYLALNFYKIQDFLKYCYSKNLTGTTNMLNRPFPYIVYIPSQTRYSNVDRQVKLPIPLPGLKLIKDFSKADNDYNIL